MSHYLAKGKFLHMAFKSWSSYGDFFREVTRSNRYFYSDDVKDFLSNVMETIKARERRVKSASVFWRAQLGSDWRPILQDGEIVGDEPVPYPPHRMTPLPFEASEGSGPAPEVDPVSMRFFWPRELGARRPSASNDRAPSAAERCCRPVSNFRSDLWRRSLIRTRRHSSTRPVGAHCTPR